MALELQPLSEAQKGVETMFTEKLLWPLSIALSITIGLLSFGAGAIPEDDDQAALQSLRRNQAASIQLDIEVMVRSSTYNSGMILTENQRVSTVTRLQENKPMEEINANAILALHNSLAAYSAGRIQELSVIKALLGLLYAKGDASQVQEFREATTDFQTIQREDFRKEIAPLIQQTQEKMKSRVFRLERLATWMHGYDRDDVEQVTEFSQALRAESEGRADNVIALNRCQKALESKREVTDK